MKRFSERHGVKPIKQAIQIDGMDHDLRNGLWNAVALHFFDPIGARIGSGGVTFSRDQAFLRAIWSDFFKYPLDSLPSYWTDIRHLLRTEFYKFAWYEVYDFLEFVLLLDQNERFIEYSNRILEREVSGYRFLDGLITPITSEAEVAAIEEAANLEGKFGPASEHIRRALELLSSRGAPDYRNSIKESISAVEAACSLVLGEKGTLGQTLKKIQEQSGLEFHPALAKAFESLYGYTSDEGGIRHALLEEHNLTFEDAKFMLVACSGFVNYIKAKSH